MALISTQRTSTSSSSSSSSSLIPQTTYDVFLSFRGKDTRKSFTDHLHAALKRSGIYTFKDDRKLEKGKDIEPELLKAIEGSMFSIIIFSKTYASSKWCLDELLKIVECKNKMGQRVVPVYYDVDPSEVRTQKGHFQEAFAKHEEVFRENPEKVQKWRAAMREVGHLSGFHLKDRHESEFIQDIVKEISSKLIPTLTSVVNDFVAMDLRLKKLSSHIGLGSDDVRIVGIYGMGGIGKTTLASVVYSQMSHHFEGSSFLANVREVSQENRLCSLQEQLLSQILMESSFSIYNDHDGMHMIRSRLCHKRVLVIIDDVDDIEQIEKLAGNHDWFGLGSRIIITTRDKHLLIAHGVDVIYEAECLNHDEALQLFSLKAFKNDHPPDDYMELCKHVVKYADGLPLALTIFGSFLYGRSLDEWISALERLREDSKKEIVDRLQISFDGLKETEKNIFLDVAFFFKGNDRDYVTKILDGCHFYPKIGIITLIEKCLITTSPSNKLWMHDLLQEMAKKIVQKESPKELGKRSRLWNKEEVYDVLTKNLGTEAVEGIIQNFSKQEEVPLSAKAFSNMNKLRVLQIQNVQLRQGLDYLSNELRFLEWHGYPLKSLPSSFEPNEIIAFHLLNSRIQQLWKGIKPLNMLTFIQLSFSENLAETPDLTGAPNLKSLDLRGCTRLSKIHKSIGVLDKLTVLNLINCKSLSSLPSFIKMESLEDCFLDGCSKLEKFPEIVAKMESLEILGVSGTAIRQFPSSTFLSMENLTRLNCRGCKGPSYKSRHLLSPFRLMQRKVLDPIPLMLPSLSGLCSLIHLDLSDCSLWEGIIPNDLGCLSSLRHLNLSSNNLVSLPASISQLSNLEVLLVEHCKRLQSLIEFPPNVVNVWAEGCSSLNTLSDSFACNFYGFKCLQVMKTQGYNSMAFAAMKRYLQEMSNQSNPRQRNEFEIVLPEVEIPEWFRHQSDGSSISIERIPLLHDSKSTKLMGIALCSLFVVHEPPPLLVDFDSHDIRCAVRFNDTAFSTRYDIIFDKKWDQAVSDHIWLQYLSITDEYFDTEGQDYSHMEFTFKTSNPRGVEVKKCGVRPVYEHDVEEFNETRDYKCTSSFFEKFNDLHQDSDGSATNVAMIKRIRDDCDEAKSTRSDSFVDESQPKRLKFTPNCF